MLQVVVKVLGMLQAWTAQEGKLVQESMERSGSGANTDVGSKICGVGSVGSQPRAQAPKGEDGFSIRGGYVSQIIFVGLSVGLTG